MDGGLSIFAIKCRIDASRIEIIRLIGDGPSHAGCAAGTGSPSSRQSYITSPRERLNENHDYSPPANKVKFSSNNSMMSESMNEGRTSPMDDAPVIFDEIGEVVEHGL